MCSCVRGSAAFVVPDSCVSCEQVFKEVQSLFRLFSVNPIFGIEHTVEERVRRCFVCRWLFDALCLRADARPRVHLLSLLREMYQSVFFVCVWTRVCVVLCSFLFAISPYFLSFFFRCRQAPIHPVRASRTADDVEIIEGDEGSDAFAAYYADGSKHSDRDAAFCPMLGVCLSSLVISVRPSLFSLSPCAPPRACLILRLMSFLATCAGLAVEQLRDGVTMEQLWNCVHDVKPGY